MNILCVGDVVGSTGCRLLRNVLPAVKRQYSVDVCIVNGENAADGNGMTLSAAGHIFDSGADVITGGNHTYRRHEFYELLDSSPAIVRPGNYPSSAPGRGLCIVDRGRYQVAVINLLGVVYMNPLACPFDTLDALIEKAGNPKFCIVDFHAEATAEKKALAYHADGRISALVGTHTHVQTADEQILPKGTGFITDIGMTGPYQSVLGIKPELAVAKMKGKIPVRFSIADGPSRMEAVLLTLCDSTGKTTAIERICVN
ncbi:MAG TPA: TIGR00282 family metallophosphoesterase [Ruminococcaceae bacterium]|nr:TIGR00282 family metallophosphoesterase [Oscillospiraceae bacterium]HCA29917.1 TIGR00282 family metallophosphoesterase [Oscillospiraceae bacterium]